MKKIVFSLMAIISCGIASAQTTNKMEPSRTASPPPGTEPIEKVSEQQVKERSRDASPTNLTSAPPQNVAPAANGSNLREPVSQPNPVTNPNSYPGAQMAYPAPQPPRNPGTVISTTEPANGTNNPQTTLPANNSSNQGKLP